MLCGVRMVLNPFVTVLGVTDMKNHTAVVFAALTMARSTAQYETHAGLSPKRDSIKSCFTNDLSIWLRKLSPRRDTSTCKNCVFPALAFNGLLNY